jgi:hypothetical protein
LESIEYSDLVYGSNQYKFGRWRPLKADDDPGEVLWQVDDVDHFK